MGTQLTIIPSALPGAALLPSVQQGKPGCREAGKEAWRRSHEGEIGNFPWMFTVSTFLIPSFSFFFPFEMNLLVLLSDFCTSQPSLPQERCLFSL